MAKKLTRSKIVKKLDAVFSQYIRQKNAINEIATCFTCGKQDHWKKLQNGHFQSRRFYSTRWNEQNCQVQCSGCNVFKYGEQFIFGKKLDEKYGEGTAEELYLKAKKTVKLSNDELIDLINRYKNFLSYL